MMKHLAPALFSLTLCAVMGGVRVADAQTVNAAVTPVADSTATVTVMPEAASVSAAAAATSRPVSGAPVILAPSGVRLDGAAFAERSPIQTAPPMMVDWKMPTSRALMIGGAATALVGLVAVKGDTGAIIALSGTAVAVYGLYLHYNR